MAYSAEAVGHATKPILVFPRWRAVADMRQRPRFDAYKLGSGSFVSASRMSLVAVAWVSLRSACPVSAAALMQHNYLRNQYAAAAAANFARRSFAYHQDFVSEYGLGSIVAVESRR